MSLSIIGSSTYLQNDGFDRRNQMADRTLFVRAVCNQADQPIIEALSSNGFRQPAEVLMIRLIRSALISTISSIVSHASWLVAPCLKLQLYSSSSTAIHWSSAWWLHPSLRRPACAHYVYVCKCMPTRACTSFGHCRLCMHALYRSIHWINYSGQNNKAASDEFMHVSIGSISLDDVRRQK